MRSIKCFIRKNAGFTMTEMVVVIAIIAILAGMMIPFFSTIMSRGDDDVADAYQKLEEANVDVTHNTLPPDEDPTVVIPTGTTAPESGGGSGGSGGGESGGEDTPSTTKDAITMTNCDGETHQFDSFTEALNSEHLKSKLTGNDAATISNYNYATLELNSDINDDIIIPNYNTDGSRTAVKIYLNGHTVTGRVDSDGIVNIYGGSKDNPTGQMGTIDARDMPTAFECSFSGGVGRIQKVRFKGKNYGIRLYDGSIMNSNSSDSDSNAGIFDCICEANCDIQDSAGIYCATDFRRIENTYCTGYYGFKTKASIHFVKNNTFIGKYAGYYKIGGTQGGGTEDAYNFSGNTCIGGEYGVWNSGAWNSNIVGTEDHPTIIIGRTGFYTKTDMSGTFGKGVSNPDYVIVHAGGDKNAVKGRKIIINTGRFSRKSNYLVNVTNGNATYYTNGSATFSGVFGVSSGGLTPSSTLTQTSGTLTNVLRYATTPTIDGYYDVDNVTITKGNFIYKYTGQ